MGLSRTLASVRDQRYKDFEWIVVDGGSSDGSVALVNDHISLVTYFESNEDNGIYHAMNKGIEHAKGEYLLFLNSGDVFLNHSVLGDVISLLGDKDIYAGSCEIVESGGARWIKHPLKKWNVFDLYYQTLPHQSTFIRRDLFERFGFYKEEFKVAGDHESWIRFALMGSNYEILPLTISEMEAGGVGTRITEDSIREKDWIHANYFKNFGYDDIHFLLFIKNYPVLYKLYKTFKNVFK